MTFRFVSNVDGTDFAEADPRSRSRRNPLHHLLEDLHHARDHDQRPHRPRLVARPAWQATTRPSPSTSSPSPPTPPKSRKFGIDTANMFGFWDWVGGRYSMDSAIGLSTMLAIGPDELPRDARRLPRRWTSISAPRRSSKICPCSWACSPSGTTISSARRPSACLPYEQYLKRFPAYLQQLTMESNGKHVTLDGAHRQLPDRPHLLGRARHQRPAFLLSVDPSGHQAHPLRLHRLLQIAQSARPPSRHACWPTSSPRPRRSLSARPPTKSRPKARPTGSSRTASSKATARRTPSSLDKLDARNPRQTRRPLRTQRLHPGHHLADRLVRPMGRRTRQGPRPAHHPRARKRGRAARSAHDSSTRQFNPPLPQSAQVAPVSE